MGPLHGISVVEFAGLGPGPFCGMMLADAGADVVRIERPRPPGDGMSRLVLNPVLDRGKRSIALDLRDEADREVVSRLLDRADVLTEGFRPGVMERLGFGPEPVLAANPRLVYGRMTGWGQSGPYAHTAGHDINYIALTGALHAFGRADEVPAAPLNLLGDFGGGGMVLAFGLLAALLHARSTGEGQVVDAAIVDGTALLTAMIHGLRHDGAWQDERGVNLLDTGAPFYDVYVCADGRYLAVGALEEPFYAALVSGLGLVQEELPDRSDPARWPALREVFAATLAGRTRDEWWAVFRGTDACVAPVLDWQEAISDEHNAHRGVFTEVGAQRQPSPAPRFGATVADPPRPAPRLGESGAEIRAELNLPPVPPPGGFDVNRQESGPERGGFDVNRQESP
ncbi:MAG: CoA transferase [Geodermatophilaceae bacterium]|nr:CoA transferase [Geodermatophilaceae bacterium]